MIVKPPKRSRALNSSLRDDPIPKLRHNKDETAHVFDHMLRERNAYHISNAFVFTGTVADTLSIAHKDR